MTSSSSNIFPQAIDSTMLNTYHNCPRQFYWSHIRRLKLKGVHSVHLHAGAAFAKGLEAARLAYLSGLDDDTSIIEGLKALWEEYGNFESQDQLKTVERMSGLLVGYFNEWPLSTDQLVPALISGFAGIEFNFAIPIEIPHPQTGEPLLITGRCDMFASYGDSFYTVDDKTTKQLGERWTKNWHLRGQFDCYAWAAHQIGVPVAGTIVRGACIRTDGYSYAQTIVSCPEWKRERWYKNTISTIRRMIEDWEMDDYVLSLGDACTSYNGCPFTNLCSRREPEPWIEVEYEPNTWNPIERS